MNNIQCLSYTAWDCKYHLVFIPKYFKKALCDHLRKDLGELLWELAKHRESQILEGHLKGDYIHMLISIPPKYAVSQVVGYIKGKSAIHIANNYLGKRKNFTGQHFGARGIMCQPLGAMKKRFANTYETTRHWIERWTRSACFISCYVLLVHKHNHFERFTVSSFRLCRRP